MYKFIFFIVFFLSFKAFSMKILDNKNPEFNDFGNYWEVITDEVMGGKSNGDFKIVKNNESFFYRLEGDVSTKNNGGFIQFRSDVETNESSFKGIKFKARGNGHDYFSHIRTPFTFLPWQYYLKSFETKNEWVEIDVPILELKKSHKLQPSSFTSEKIKSIGFVAYGKDHIAKLDIKEIEFY